MNFKLWNSLRVITVNRFLRIIGHLKSHATESLAINQFTVSIRMCSNVLATSNAITTLKWFSMF